MGQVTAKVTLLGEIRGLAGRRNMEVALLQGSTVEDLLRDLSRRLGNGFARGLFRADGTLHHYVKVFVNGDEVQSLGGLHMTLGGGQIDILILPMYTGG